MSSFRFLHAADIHLDSPLSGLVPFHDCPTRSPESSTRTALTNMVRLAIQQKVDFVLIAGDLYDGKWQDHTTGLFFTAQMSILRQAGIPVVVIRGNHDAESKITGHLRLPENVELLESGKISRATNDVFDRLGVDVVGYSYLNQAELDNVVLDFPTANPNRYSIGLLHTSLEGDSHHERYVPCSLLDLKNKGYQYWALGHIHKRQIVSEDPLMVFPGNIQGRHIKEEGEKGCYIVDVDPGGRSSLTFFGLDVLRWQRLEIDLSKQEDWNQAKTEMQRLLKEEVAGLLQENGPRAIKIEGDSAGEILERHSFDIHFSLRIVLKGKTAVFDQLRKEITEIEDDFRSLLIDLGDRRFWLEKVVNKTQPKSTATDQADDDSFNPRDIIRQLALEPEISSELMTAMDKVVKDLLKKVPDSIRSEMDWAKEKDDFLKELMAELPEEVETVANQGR